MLKSKNRFLYLALLFFLGIITVLVADGYMGLYDTLKLRSGEYEQVFEADYWQRGASQVYYSVGGGDTINGTYIIDNRRFSAYQGNLTITLERNQQPLSAIANEDFSVTSFGKQEFDFTVDTSSLAPVQDDNLLEYTLVIQHGDTERRIIFNVSRLPVPAAAGA